MARPFANKMTEVMGELAKRTDQDFHHPLLDLRGDQRYLLVLITADKGLCGFNTNLTKAAQAFIRENPDKNIEIMASVARAATFSQSAREYYERVSRIDRKGSGGVLEALEVAQTIIKQYTEDKEIDKVFLIYNEFKSVLSQRVVLEQLLPISHATAEETETKQAANLVDYIYEQPPGGNVQHAPAAPH